MTKRLPPPPADPQIATQDEVDGALDEDAPVELVETKRAAYAGPRGLCFSISVDCRPTQALLHGLAGMIEAADAGVSKREAAVEKREKALAAKGRRQPKGRKP